MRKKGLGEARFSYKFIKNESFFPNKKGQITIFIILGIVLLLAVILIILFRKEIITINPDEIIPTEKSKVESYVTACMDQLGNEALIRIGLQGGYVEVPADISRDLTRHLQTAPFSVVPYWTYGPDTFIPPLEQIKADIDAYIEQNLRSCLFGRSAFNNTYDITEKSEIIANTEIVESKVIFNVHWDIEVKDKSGEIISELINHISESPIKLKRIYDLSRRIVEKEMEELKFEDLTQDLISMEHPDVPVAGTELSCSKKTWEVSKVRNTLLHMLQVNIKELKIKGTDFVEFPEELPYYQNHYIWDLGEDYANPEISARFKFEENYPSTFAVTPTSGSKLKSSSLGGSGIISFLCLQSWKFTYDLTYPVLATIRDETTGYDFNFGFTVHLYRNNPYRGQVSARASAPIDTTSDEDYCQAKNIPLTVKTYELVENGMGVSSREDLGGVNISLTCLKYRCEMGSTEYDYGGAGFAGLITNYPYCVGGILRGDKLGYKEAWERVVTESGKEIELNLIPLYYFSTDKIKIVKHEFNGPNSIGPAKSLEGNEAVLIELKYDSGNTTSKRITQEQQFVLSPSLRGAQQDPIQFLAKADFNYKLEVKLLDGEEFKGGYSGILTLPWKQLEQAQEIVIHILSKENPSEEESWGLLSGLGANSVYLPVPEIN